MAENDKILDELKKIYPIYLALQQKSNSVNKTSEEKNLEEIELVNPYFSRFEYSEVEPRNYGG